MASPNILNTDLTSAAIAAEMEADIASRVSELREAGINPNLVIHTDNLAADTPTARYIAFKTDKALKLGMNVATSIRQDYAALEESVQASAESESVHGMIVQLPLEGARGLHPEARNTLVDRILNQVPAQKDVDGLRTDGTSWFDPATPSAVLSLLMAHDKNYKDKHIVVRGQGRLVGAPLLRMLRSQGVAQVDPIDEDTPKSTVAHLYDYADIIITATGSQAGFSPKDFSIFGIAKKIVIDAGTAEQSGKLVGDVSDELREWGKLFGSRFSAKKGGVGPLTVLHLLGNVVTAAESQLVNSASHMPQRPAVIA